LFVTGGGDELRLAAGAVRRCDKAPGEVVGDLRAIVGSDNVQAQIDSSGGAS
jgi:hypothetical protein